MREVPRIRPSVMLGVVFIAMGVYANSARSGDSTPSDHDHLHHHHFFEFAKVPERARARRSATEKQPKEGGRLRTCAPKKCRVPRRAHFSGFLPTASSAAGCRCGQSSPNRSGGDRHLYKVFTAFDACAARTALDPERADGQTVRARLTRSCDFSGSLREQG